MQELWHIFTEGYKGYGTYLWHEISHPGWHNYFYALSVISLLFLLLEWIKPWRQNQPKFRKDFWLDAFYMYFNFFIFSLIIYNAGSDVIVHLVRGLVSKVTSIDLTAFDPLQAWPLWSVLLLGFILRDFIQWWTHRLLHRVSWLWEFHKVHHSVKEMGFAAHLRYHWMETVVYRTVEYLPLAFLGIGLYDFFIIHIFSLFIGHYNHSNLTVSPRLTGTVLGSFIGILIGSNAFEISIIGSSSFSSIALGLTFGGIIGYFAFSLFIRYLFNSPEMHIWHHAKNLPENTRYGVNFGLSLAIWDYLFKTAYIPHNGRDIELGFPEDKHFPKSFISQITHGF